MRSWLIDGGGIKSKIEAFAKRHGWVLFLIGCLILSVAVAIGYSKLQDLPTPLVTATSTPSSSATSTTPEPLAFEDTYNIHPRVETSHWLAWAMIDMKSGIMVGSENWNQPTYVMSMIKPWIVVDYLNHHQSPDDWTLSRLTSMIVDSNDQVARDYFGGGPSLDRLIKTCELTDVVKRNWSWSLTQISARDAARMGECIYSGRATSPMWTAWVVDKMRHVRGDGDFGPRQLFQDRTTVATKNGWFNWEGKWYINCLAITDNWTISILQQWPYEGGSLRYGIGSASPVCKSIASQVLKLNV